MGPRLLAAIAALLASAAAGCGDDGSSGYVEDPQTGPAARPVSNAACSRVRGHPVRLNTDPLRDLVACGSRTGRSLYLRNRSSQVLRVRAEDLYDRTRAGLIRGIKEPPGIDAAHSTTGGGMDARRESLVLPLDGRMIARSGSTVAVTVEGDLRLTVAANVARYVAEWAASEVSLRGERLVRPVRRCAASIRGSIEAGYVEDALRLAVDTPVCRRVIDDFARESGADPSKSREAILRRARPVRRDRLEPRRTMILARR